jgi:hypothetical protein
MNNIIRKLTSRKLWVALAGLATGMATLFGAESSDIQAVSGAVLSAISVLTYIMVEGAVDKTALNQGGEQ